MDYYKMNLAMSVIAKSEAKNISKLCNAMAAIWENATDINWVGIYLLDEDTNDLYLGPFQGKIACSSIDLTLKTTASG